MSDRKARTVSNDSRKLPPGEATNRNVDRKAMLKLSHNPKKFSAFYTQTKKLIDEAEMSTEHTTEFIKTTKIREHVI